MITRHTGMLVLAILATTACASRSEATKSSTDALSCGKDSSDDDDGACAPPPGEVDEACGMTAQRGCADGLTCVLTSAHDGTCQ